MVSGKYLEKNDRDKIILGREVSGGYGAAFENEGLGGVDTGDKIDVIFGNGIKREYEIKGIFSTKNIGCDQLAFITQKEMESVLGRYNMASEIIVKIEDTGQEQKYIKEFRELGIVKEEIKPWTEYMGFTASITESFDMISIMLGAIGAIVAGITIFIVIYVSVVNRKKQIGILKAIGMRERIIVRSYILQALFYAILGIGAGLILIYFLIVPYFIKNPLDFPMGWVSLAVTQNNLIISSISLIAAAIIGGFIPSRRGAKESIIDAIWGS
jgi:putative ABC transport system permease protein